VLNHKLAVKIIVAKKELKRKKTQILENSEKNNIK
jgi:hypothetical protein|tara:strand:+ start:11895 stop:11999 length:105 start_codon:yes stop_codon:yes gene_type:complete